MSERQELGARVASRFRLEVGGVDLGTFEAVDGVGTSKEIAAGGSDLLTRESLGGTTASVVLLRGYINNTELWKWYQDAQAGKVQRRSGSVILCGDDGSEIMRYNLFEAWPNRWKNPPLSSPTPKTPVEEIELAVERIERG
ncbi:phage tail protein [Haliangium sp.]|uniref:phage tail protein n=1 Tax=Haliangium sp. TaxID=2663208 RepID=UPI003D0A1D83